MPLLQVLQSGTSLNQHECHQAVAVRTFATGQWHTASDGPHCSRSKGPLTALLAHRETNFRVATSLSGFSCSRRLMAPVHPDEQSENPHECERRTFVLAQGYHLAMRAGIPSDYSDALSSRGFELEQRIAGGADGEVYLARQSKLRRRIVAIKFLREHLALDTKRRERFEREADILAQVNSRAVPFVLTRGAVSRPGGSVPYFVMENVDGRTLYDIVVKTGPLSLRRTIRIALDLLDALDEAHALQIVHRDVRPANVIVGERRTTLVDFSLGADRKLVVSPTKQGDGLGNWEYAAPEQKADAKTADHRCDLYSLGRTIRFMLTGSATAHPASPTEPPVIKDVLDRATAVKPDDRYASSRAFAEALKAISAYERPEGAIAGGWVICPMLGAQKPAQRARVTFEAPTSQTPRQTHTARHAAARLSEAARGVVLQ